MRTLLLLPLLVACDDFQLEDVMPQVSFQRMEVEDIDFEHVDAAFVFAIDNPNPVEIHPSSFSWALDLEQTDFLSGSDEDGFDVEAVGSSELALPVSLTWQGAWDTVQATRGEDYVDFALDGHFGFMTRWGEAEVPYDAGGDFPALRTPKFSFQRVKVTRLDALDQTASLEIDLGVDNAHASTLFFDAFDYTLTLGGRDVADGLIRELGGVEGASEQVLTLPVTVDLLAAGIEVATAIANKERIDVGLDARMDVDTPFGILPLTVDETGRVDVE